ncbi:DUF6211 family protein [Streptomyces sp. NPDC002324]
MLDDQNAPAGDRAPQPYDLVRLSPGNRFGLPADTLLTVADLVDDEPGVLEVHHQYNHPDHLDWAAAVTAEDIATVIRVTAGTVETWSLHP